METIHKLREDLLLVSAILEAFYNHKHLQSSAFRSFEILSKDLLNIKYNSNLINLNISLHNPNVKAIDLCDKQKKICVQVTINATPAKIKNTITKFEKSKLYEQYHELIIFSLKDTRSYKEIKQVDSSRYTVEVYDFKEFINVVIDNNDINKINLVMEQLRKELGSIQIKYYNEDKCLENILRVINRNAIKHNMHQEGSNLEMIKALNEINQVIMKGTLANGTKITNLTNYDFKNEDINKFLDDVYCKISRIKALVAELGGKEENGYFLILDNDTHHKQILEINTLKEKILTSSKDIAKKFKLKLNF